MRRSDPVTDIDSLNIALDRLDGAEAIAAFRGEPLHRTRYLIRMGLIPVAREGERIIASKRVLREHYMAATSAKAAGHAGGSRRARA
jgi:hypothetical protein